MGILQEILTNPERPLLPGEVFEVVADIEQLTDKAYEEMPLRSWAMEQLTRLWWAEDWMDLWLVDKYDVSPQSCIDHPLYAQFDESIRLLKVLFSDLKADYPTNETLMPNRYCVMHVLSPEWIKSAGVYAGPWGTFSLAFKGNPWGGFDISALATVDGRAILCTVEEILLGNVMLIAQRMQHEQTVTSGR